MHVITHFMDELGLGTRHIVDMFGVTRPTAISWYVSGTPRLDVHVTLAELVTAKRKLEEKGFTVAARKKRSNGVGFTQGGVMHSPSPDQHDW